MFERHLKSWPVGLPHHLELPNQTLFDNLDQSFRRHPDKVAIRYYGNDITYAELHSQVERLAAYLQLKAGISKGDRVLLYMQNSPQYVIGYYAILRADAVVIPVNPMNRAAELQHLAKDTQASVTLTGQELIPHIMPLIEDATLSRLIVAAYADMADETYDLPMPKGLTERSATHYDDGALIPWETAQAANLIPLAMQATPDDLAVIPFSSGTAGNPKGCMHSHRTIMATALAMYRWFAIDEPDTHLATLPFFHVTGMQASMNGPIYAGGTIVIMSRWDRSIAAELIKRYQITHWRSISTMAIDLINDPKADQYDLSSLRSVGGGGASMPEIVASKVRDILGQPYIEGYGLSETIASTHLNPVKKSKRQCLGIPIFDVDCRILNLESDEQVGPNEPGEIVTHGPQVFLGYWNQPDADKTAFIEIDGKPFFRTGDIAYYDEEGYFFMVDRVKRMINASGFKVWPAEVEALMYEHPDIEEVCIIGIADERRGESVKAFIVPKPDAKGDLDEASIIAWSKQKMAAYKCPQEVEFVDRLPKSGSGKVLWKSLMEQEQNRAN